MDPITLPDLGVDTAGYLTAGGTAIAAIVAVAIGLWFAFRVIRVGIRWARRIG